MTGKSWGKRGDSNSQPSNAWEWDDYSSIPPNFASEEYFSDELESDNDSEDK